VIGTWIFRGAVIALLSAVAYGQWRQGLLEPVLPAPAGAALPALDGRLQSVESTLRLQSAALGQALGQAVPVQLAEASEAALAGLERAVATPESWPADAAQVQSLNDRLLQVLQPLPPWAQDALLPRLLPLKWSIQALWILRSPVPEAREDLVNFQTNVQAHLDVVSDGVLPPLRDEVAQRRDAVTAALRAVTLREARAAIDAPPPEGAPRDRQIERAAALLGSLGGAEDDETRKLRTDLEALALRLAAEKVVEEAKAQRAQAQQAAEGVLAEHALRQARQGLMDLRLRLAGLKTPLRDELARLAKSAADETAAIDGQLARLHAEKLRAYQTRVLADLKKAKPAEGWMPSAEAKQAAADRLKALAWVDRSLLDPVVSDWFHTVYKEVFEKLEKPQKEQVVEAFATTAKRGLE
jgi:hypothetical protein